MLYFFIILFVIPIEINIGFFLFNCLNMPNLFEFARFSSYPGAYPLDILKPYGLYKPADRLMRYDGITNITPRFHPSTSIFKVRNIITKERIYM